MGSACWLLAESRSLEVRCGMKTKGQDRKRYVHMLNGTLCATERALCCLVENYQTPEVRFSLLPVSRCRLQRSELTSDNVVQRRLGHDDS